MGEKKKKRMGDRWDATLIRDLDSMHFVMPCIYPDRCNNEAFISERIDLTNLNVFLAKKNTEGIAYKYNVFQVIVAAYVKAVVLRPKMNRFIANKNMYQRDEITASFVVKKLFDDHGGEALAFLHCDEHDTIDTIHEKIYEKVSYCRSDNVDASTNAMDIFNKMPRFLSKFLIAIARGLDKRGKLPRALVETDPYYASVIFSNLGSLKLHSGYHHLTNWGTTSVFVIVGERKKRPFYDEDSNMTMRDSIDLGMTIDERIADGYYYAKTIRLLKKLLENPALLEQEFATEIEY